MEAEVTYAAVMRRVDRLIAKADSDPSAKYFESYELASAMRALQREDPNSPLRRDVRELFAATAELLREMQELKMDVAAQFSMRDVWAEIKYLTGMTESIARQTVDDPSPYSADDVRAELGAVKRIYEKVKDDPDFRAVMDSWEEMLFSIEKSLLWMRGIPIDDHLSPDSIEKMGEAIKVNDDCTQKMRQVHKVMKDIYNRKQERQSAWERWRAKRLATSTPALVRFSASLAKFEQLVEEE